MAKRTPHHRREYKGWFGRKAKRRCPHGQLSGVHGDDIQKADGYRLFCHGCGMHIDGPVGLANRTWWEN